MQVQSQCRVHDECDDPQICHQGSCQNACRFQTCGLNAICVAQNHVAQCQCLANYFSDNPNIGCQASKCMSVCYIPWFLCMSISMCLLPSQLHLQPSHWKLDARAMMTALTMLHAKTPTASTPVLWGTLVHHLQPVEWSIMHPFARVLMATLAHQRLSADLVSCVTCSGFLLNHFLKNSLI